MPGLVSERPSLLPLGPPDCREKVGVEHLLAQEREVPPGREEDWLSLELPRRLLDLSSSRTLGLTPIYYYIFSWLYKFLII